MRDTISLPELKKNLRQVMARVKAGETLTITQRGQPIARLEPAASEQAPDWHDLLADVRAAARARVSGRPAHPNPVLAERIRRRR